MGCGNTDAATLAGFLDLPVTGDVMNNSQRSVEGIMGPIQIEKREQCEMEAVVDEVAAHIASNDMKKKEYNIDGHKHPPLPMLKGSYGNFYYNISCFIF